MLSSTFVQSLEEEIDRRGLARVLLDLSTIATAKGLHVLDNWQDRSTAKDWAAVASFLAKAANAEPVRRVSR